MRRAPVFLAVTAALLAATVVLPSPAGAEVRAFQVELTGANEVPATPSSATALAAVTIDDQTNAVCAYLALSEVTVAEITGMHIHSAPAGINGPIVVTFTPDQTTCATSDPGTVAAILADPAAYYLNIHTVPYPAGEIRGQLAAITPGSAPAALTGTLSGAAEVPPTPVATTGQVGVIVDPDTSLVCVAVALEDQDIANITAMHIHQAPTGVNGPIVVPFDVGTASCSPASAGVIAALVADPTGFYVNLHSAAYPAGEARAQLAALVVPEPPEEAPPAVPVEAEPAFTG